MLNIQDHFPPELLSVKQWVVHRNKIPVNPYTLYNASTSNPDTWSDFDTAFSVCKKGQADGVGFVFASGQGYVGIDIDTCIDPSTNSISDEALEIVKMFDTYTEISPSGYGLHMIIKADPHIPLPHNKYEMKQNGIVRIKKETGEAKIPEVEIYNEKRFFTCTGNVWGKSKPIAERTDILTGFIARLEAKRRQSHNPAQITKNFIAHCFDNDEEQINLLYKIFGVAISNIKAWRGKKAFFIIGPGDTGKTLLRNLLCHLIGKENCGTEDLHKLNDRFHMSVLDKKRLGGYSDMSTVTVKDWTLFKNLVGGDPVQIEFKNKDLYSATFDGLLLFTANQMPPCPPDTEPEVFNRMCIMKTIGIAYDKDAKPSPDAVEKDPNLLGKLLADDVKQYIVYQAIQGLRDFIKDNWSYHIPTKNQKHLEEYRESVDSVKAFVKSCCVKVSDCSGKIDRFSACTFYKVYCNWCGEAGFGKYMLGKSDFHNSLYNLGYGLTTEYCGNDSFNLLTLNQTIRKKYNIKPISKKSVKISDAP